MSLLSVFQIVLSLACSVLAGACFKSALDFLHFGDYAWFGWFLFLAFLDLAIAAWNMYCVLVLF